MNCLWRVGDEGLKLRRNLIGYGDLVIKPTKVGFIVKRM